HGTGGIMTRGLGSRCHPRGLTPSGGSGPRVTRPPLPLSPRGVGPLPFWPRGLGCPDPL
ncbi:Os12g0405300, partial [Oryza sativa Japonica Group]